MKLAYSDTDAGLVEAVDFVNSLTDNDDFWNRIASHDKFVSSALSGSEIARRLRACSVTVTVRHWHPKFRPHTVAVTDPDLPYQILYNIRNFAGNSAGEKVHTVMHEFVHNVDLFDDGNRQAEYTHDGGPFSETAPYWIGDLAQSFHSASAGDTFMAKSIVKAVHADQTGYTDDICSVDAAELRDNSGG